MRDNRNEYIKKLIEEIPFGIPFFSTDIVDKILKEVEEPRDKIKSAVNVSLKRYADKNIIERIQKGVYYKPKMTVFGKMKMPIDLTITEICTKDGDNIIGYIGSHSLLNELGLTTLLPKNKVIVTNKYRTKIVKETNIKLKTPVTEINKNNYRYLQIMDAISMLDDYYIDTKEPDKILYNHISNYRLDKIELLKIARKHYSNKVLNKTLDIILEDNNEFTHW